MNTQIEQLEQQFTAMQVRVKEHAELSLSQRQHLLKQLKESLLAEQDNLISALNEDYGQRSKFDSLMADILPTISHLNYTLKKLPKWVKPQRRHSGLLMLPSTVRVFPCSLGIVGVMVPWNFPINLTFAPLISAIAAGNRVAIKLSEFTPATNKVIIKVCAVLKENVFVVQGEQAISERFTHLPFDHLFFTGSTSVGRHVMAAAAKNLTPVTLELGGKSPVVIAPNMCVKHAVERIIFGKCLNSGQICVAPDYVLLPEEQLMPFITAFQETFSNMYPNGVNDSDYSSVINTAQFERLSRLLKNARDENANIYPACEPSIDVPKRRMVPHLVTQLSVDNDLLISEIFGPILPIITYKKLDEAIAYINARPHPLALYIMSFDTDLQQKIMAETRSGGVAINDTVLQVALEDAPFGGVGASGMGQYHGFEGFNTFSKSRTVLKSYRFNPRATLLIRYRSLLMNVIKRVFIR